MGEPTDKELIGCRMTLELTEKKAFPDAACRGCGYFGRCLAPDESSLNPRS